jgi:hypothetical protein
MKKLIAGLLFLSGLGAIGLTDGAMYRSKSIQESIVLSEPVIGQMNEYATVSVDEATARLSKAGEPVLPAVTRVLTFPLGSKNIRVDVGFSRAYEIVLLKQVRPGPQPVPKTGMQVLKDPVKKAEVYESSELYPSDAFRYRVGAGIKGDQRVIFLTVHCYPVQYAPAANMLHFSERVNIRVTYDEPIVPVSFPDVYDMVVIAPSTFSDELQPLIAHKNSRGVQTVLKTRPGMSSLCYWWEEQPTFRADTHTSTLTTTIRTIGSSCPICITLISTMMS